MRYILRCNRTVTVRCSVFMSSMKMWILLPMASLTAFKKFVTSYREKEALNKVLPPDLNIKPH